MSITSYGDYWNMNVGYTAEVNLTPKDMMRQVYNNTVISVNFTASLIPLDSPDCKTNTKELGYNSVSILFSKLSDSEYRFNTGKFYIIANNKRYNLKLLDGKVTETTYNITPQETKEGGYYWPNRHYKYRLPLLCDELNNAVVEISGIYKDGVEMPPIKFKINIIKNEMKSK